MFWFELCRAKETITSLWRLIQIGHLFLQYKVLWFYKYILEGFLKMNEIDYD